MLVIVCFAMLLFYLMKRRKGECGWEEIFVCSVEMFLHFVNLCVGESHLIELKDGRQINWFRYAGWLITCPVILIQLSNLDGSRKNKSRESVMTNQEIFITANQAMIVCGFSASLCQSFLLKYMFFMCASVFYAYLCLHAARVFSRVYDRCPQSVETVALIFYMSWTSFPIMWIAADLGYMTHAESVVGHCFADLISKNLFGFLAWRLQWKVLKRDDSRTISSVELGDLLRVKAKRKRRADSGNNSPKDPSYGETITCCIDSAEKCLDKTIDNFLGADPLSIDMKQNMKQRQASSFL